MLIRVVGHFKNNPKHIDKMIAIKGLPDEWIFREGPNGKELIAPWRADIDKNIPMDIRNLCEPVYVTFRYPPIEKGQNWIIDHRQVLGLVIDYMTEPGRELWEKVERFVEGTIPRNERVPSMVILAKDEHAPFETYMAKRDAMNHLYFEASPVPDIDLRPYLQKKEPVITTTLRVPVNVVATVTPVSADAKTSTPVSPVAEAPEFKCEHCVYTHRSKQGIRMHTVKRHPLPEKVVV